MIQENNPNADLIELIKFGLVGASGILVNFFILFIFSTLLKWPNVIAILLGIIFSMLSNYILNRIWTFKSEGKILNELLKYITGNSIGAAFQFILSTSLDFIFRTFWTEFYHVGKIKLDVLYIASFIGIIAAFIFNFIFSKKLVFTSNQMVS
ncbi:MAG: GtrA family protein [Candidatus Heimdallarchaeota archaeon]|nr:GtrA family protein [Candidatus Heimdallarchaeota archaeon]